MNRLAVAAAAAALSVAVAACGLGGDDELQRLDSNDLFGLDETTTTSTTTTTTTIVPPPSVDSTIGATTTTIATEPVELFYIDGDRLADVVFPLTRGTQGPSALRVMRALERALESGDVGIVGLRSAVPPDLVTTVTESAAGYASVDLSGTVFETIEDSDQRLAFAQIVLTLTRRPGIGQVRFSVDDEAIGVPGRDNVIRGAGELVSFEDYESLLLERNTETTVAVTDPTSTTIGAPPSTT